MELLCRAFEALLKLILIIEANKYEHASECEECANLSQACEYVLRCVVRDHYGLRQVKGKHEVLTPQLVGHLLNYLVDLRMLFEGVTQAQEAEDVTQDT